MSPVLLLLPLLLILLIVVAVARATPRVHCITGHVVGARCVCSPEAWQPGVRRSTDWLYATFGGARCHWQDVCDRQLCSSRGGECHGARCLFDADHTGDGERCMPVADDLPHVPESDVQTATQIRSTARSALKHLPRPVQSRAIALALESSANAAECRHTSRPIRIAYAITIHDTRSARVTAAALREKSTGLAQLALMLQTLWRPNDVFALHVEPSAASAYVGQVRRLAARYDNVFVVSNADRVVWSGASVVESLVRSMHSLLRFEWDVFVNLSGADFPVRGVSAIARTLAPLSKLNLVYGNYVAALAEPARSQLERHVRETMLECRGSRAEQAYQYERGRKPPFNALANGHLWMVLERRFVDYVVQSARAQSLRRFFALTRVPDEKFFLTALLDAPHLRHTWMRRQTRFIEWLSAANHPITLRNDNRTFDAMRSSDRLFARKLSFTKSANLLARLAAAATRDNQQ